MPDSSQARNSYPGWSHDGNRIRLLEGSGRRSSYQEILLCTRDVTENDRDEPPVSTNVESFSPPPFGETRACSELSTATTLNSGDPVQQLSDSRRQRLRSVGWRMSFVVLPTAFLSALLLGLVLAFQVDTQQSLFTGAGKPPSADQSTYILVNYSATRLVFVTSLLSMLASLLGRVIMDLWSLCTARTLQQATMQAVVDQDTSELPDTDDFRSLVGLFLAAPEELLNYLLRCSKKRLSLPAVLHRAAMMFTFSLLLAFGLFVANTILQYVTQSVNVEAITPHLSPSFAFGRGMSAFCLDFNRTANNGFPCTYVITPVSSAQEVTMLANDQNEVSYLQHNISSTSEIRLIDGRGLGPSRAAIVMPQVQALPSNIDYRASTIGVSTQCRPMTQKCAMTTIPGTPNTQFNCTEDFWGILGRPPNASSLGTVRAEDPDLPPMALKPSQTLQFEFFSDPDLKHVYNTGEFDPSTGDFVTTHPPLPDADLVNPVYMAVAGRLAADLNNPTSDPGFFQGGWQYRDFVLNCSYVTYEVHYTWVNATIQNATFTISPNGSLAEMYHGLQNWLTLSDGSPILQDDLNLAGLQNTSGTFADEWASLYSINVLSLLGAYSTPRMNLQEQERTPMLVTQMPKVPLGVLLAFSMTYVVLGLILGFFAYRASSADVWALAQELTFSAVVAAAFREHDKAGSIASPESPTDEHNGSKAKDEKSRRVRPVESPGNGWRFVVLEDEKAV